MFVFILIDRCFLFSFISFSCFSLSGIIPDLKTKKFKTQKPVHKSLLHDL